MGEAIEVEADGRPVRVSNPDKVYFPALGADGGTKLDLVRHYLAVGPGIVAALRNRPTYLQRFPDGVEGEEIYQKRVPPKHPEWISTCRVSFPSGRSADALQVTDVAQVVWAANLGCVTFHPWHARCTDVDHPDELRIDLDPQPGTAFEQARRIALDVVRPLLAELALVGYPKTSGGRGVHIYVRIRPEWTFPQVRHAAIAVAREVERRVPELATTAWWKEERGEKVFVDYNQNARDRTIASAYSVRRTARATVSTPVTWDELADADPDDFTLRTVGERFGRVGDLNAGIDDVSFGLEELLERYERDERDRGLGDLPYPPNYPKMPGEPMRVQPSRARRRPDDTAPAEPPAEPES